MRMDIDPRTRQTTAERVIAKGDLNVRLDSVFEVVARLVCLKNVKSTSLQTATFRRNLRDWVRSKPMVRLAKYQIIEIAF